MRSYIPSSHHFGAQREMIAQEEHFPSTHFIRYSGYPFPHTVISSSARNLPCTLLFPAPFAEGFPFPAVSHRTLYQYARKIPRLCSGWRYGSGAFPTYPLYGTWVTHPPYRHFENSEKSSSHSALSCFLRRSILVFCFHTYDIIPSCKKDPSASLGVTIQE